jgi:CRP-like cAMP-binding protein
VLKADGAGRQGVISTVGKGTVVVEMSLLDNAGASATMVAKTPFRALELGRAAFLQMQVRPDHQSALADDVWSVGQIHDPSRQD